MARQLAIPAQALRVACPSDSSKAGRHAAAQPAQRIPAGFMPIAVVQCSPAVVSVNGPQAAAVKEVAVSGLGRLVAALRAPSVRMRPDVICPAQAIYIPWFVLVGKNGQVIRPKVPHGDCGEPLAPVLASLNALHWVKASR
ncbi:MAG TPA: hypothetical protein VE733_28265 [Streptosporangiaceae bacterium]|nr:hypothetical protein [Streptosporangiaceae bacterium]